MVITIVSGVIENVPVPIFSLICQLCFCHLDDVISFSTRHQKIIKVNIRARASILVVLNFDPFIPLELISEFDRLYFDAISSKQRNTS